MEVHGTPGFGRDLLVEGGVERPDCNGREGRLWPGGDARRSTSFFVMGGLVAGRGSGCWVSLRGLAEIGGGRTEVRVDVPKP